MERQIVRNIGVDLLKVMSVLGVIALHTQRSLQTGECYNPILYYLGRFSMPVFFMINGYLILSKNEFSVTYYIKKVMNIFRLLVIWSVITGIFFWIKGYDFKAIIWQMARNMAGRGIIPFWFFFSFIAIYTVLLFSFDFIRNNIRLMVAILGCVCVAFDMTTNVMIFLKGGYFVQASIPQMFRLWTWLFYFCLGYYLKIQETEVSVKSGLICLVILTAVAVLYQYFVCDVFLRQINSEYLYDNLILIMWAMQIMKVFFSINYKNAVVIKMVTVLSANSFGVFLIHNLFIYGFDLTNCISTFVDASLLWIGVTSGCFALSTVLSRIPYINSALKY